MPATPTAASRSETQQVAHSGAISFVGAAFSGAMGFALTFALARSLGSEGAGDVWQAIAVFTIVLSLARAGMDTAAVWYLPRLVDSDVSRLRGALTAAILPVALGGTALGALVWTLAPTLVVADGSSQVFLDAVRSIAWFVPVGASLLVLLAATRALGGLRAYIGVGSVLVPLARPIAVIVVVALGGSTVAAAVAWAAPLPVGLLAVVLVVRHQVRRHERQAGVHGRWRPERVTAWPLYRFGAPRTLSTALEQVVVWMDVLLVGAIAGSAAAGVYGSASRFVAAGLVIDSALRIVVAPRFSRLLFAQKMDQVQTLFSTASVWLVLFATPIYLLLGVFAPAVLGWLGPGFDEGAAALAILCVGTSVTLAAGNIHSLLLMSGRSGWGAINKLTVVAINVLGNLVLIPVWGIEGAAAVWALSMLTDAVMAAVEVRIFIGTRIEMTRIGYVLIGAVLTVGVPALLVRALLGATTVGLLSAALLGAALLATWAWRDRKRLHLDELAPIVGRGRGPEVDRPSGDGSNV